MGTNYIAPIWRMPRNANKDKLSNYSIEFNSSNTESITTSDNISISGSQSRTMSVWLKGGSANNNKSWPMAVAFGIGSTNRAMWIGGGGSPSAYWYFGFWGSPSATSGDLDSGIRMDADDNWHLLTSVYDESTQTAKGYIDGVEVVSGSRALNTGSSPLIIGKHLTNNYWWDGPIAQVSIFDYALDQDQINYLYNLNNPMAMTGAKPVAYWPLGDNSNPNAPGSFPNISVGSGSVFQFDRSSLEYVKIDGPALNFTDKMSFSAWAKFTSTSQDVYTVAANFDPNSGYKFQMSYYRSNTGSGSLVRVQLAPANSNVPQNFEVPVSQLDVNKWYHLAFTFDGTTNTDGFNIYIDNTKYSFTANNPGINSNTTNGTRIGNYQNNNVWAMIGEISNVQFWDTNLQDSDIATLYNNGQPLMTGTQPQEANLEAWYKLDQSANWEADTAGNWQIPDNRSAYPQSFYFDGSSFINSGTGLGSSLGDSYAGDLTFSTWIKLPPSSNNQKGIFCIDNINQPEFALVNFTNQIWLYTSGDGTNIARFSTSIEDNNWHHLVLVYDADDASNTQLYIDKTPVSKTVINNQPASLNFNGDNTVIGTYYNTTGTFDLTGQLSNSQIWNTALSSTQVETLYNNGVPLTTAIATDNLKVWYKLDNTAVWYENTGQWGMPNAASTNTQIINFSN